MSDSHPHESARLPEWLQAALLLAFGAGTVASIRFFADSGLGRPDLLLLGASLGAMFTGGLWIALLAGRRSLAWALAMGALIWVPYLNFVIASIYARRYWSDGARAPALLAIAGMVGQSLASVRMFFANGPSLV